MSTKKIVANTIYFGVVPKLTLFVSVIILPLITPYLSTFDYGVQGVLNSYTNLIVMIAPLGMHVHLTNSYFEYPGHYNLIWGRVLFVFLISGIVFGIANSLILFYILPFDDLTTPLLLGILGSFQIFFFGNTMMAQHLFALEAKPKPLVFTNLISSIIGLMVSFVMIYFFRLGFWGLIATNAVTTILSFVVFIKFIWIDYNIMPIVNRNLNRFKNQLKIALPLIPHSMGFVLLSSSAGIVMTLYGIDYNEIGLFNHGCGIGNYIIIITTALVTALVPQSQRAYRKGDMNKYRQLYFLVQGVAITLSLLFCIWMPEIYSFLIKNEQLSQSSSIASMICFANVVYPLYCYMSNSAFIEKQTFQLLWLVFVPGFVNLILCLVFIPLWGYRVAVYSTMLAYWSQILIPFIVSYYRNKVKLWINNLNRLLFLFGIIILCVIVGNSIIKLAVTMRVLFTILCIVAFLYIYYKKRINLVIE